MNGPRAPEPNAAPASRAAPPLPRTRAAVSAERRPERAGHQPDLARLAALERSRGRLVLAAAGFGLLFGAVALKLTHATLIDPREPRRIAARAPAGGTHHAPVGGNRASVTDRNGEILAVSLPVTALVANPRLIDNPSEVADRLVKVLPQLERERLVARLSGDRSFAYISRASDPARSSRR